MGDPLMIKRTIPLFSLLVSSLSFNVLTAQAQSCPNVNNPQSTAYIQRDQDKRCEGIQASDISGDFSLISFTVGQLKPANTLTLQVPDRLNHRLPNVHVLSRDKSYQLDLLQLHSQGDRFRGQWADYVLKTENIPLDSLRATAFVRSGSQLIYLPVILSSGSGKYAIVLSSERRVRILFFQILHNGKKFYNSSRNTFQPKGQINFSWDGHNAPAGRYELRVKAELEQDNAPPEPVSINVAFEHDPQWLK